MLSEPSQNKLCHMIPVSNLERPVSNDRAEIESAIGRVLDSGWLVLGPENEALEAELSTFLGVTDTILVGNGTDALEIALSSIGVRPGTSVLTVANAGGYATTAIQKLGAQPVYVDVDDGTLQMSLWGPRGLSEVVSSLAEAPSAVIVTHLYGKAAPVEEIQGFLDRRGIPFIEDCAQSLGAKVRERRLGSFGLVSTTSFYPTKNLGALGDGGALFTSDTEIAARARALRQYGWTSKYYSEFPGGQNSRLDEIQAAIIRFRLPKLDCLNHRRSEILRRFASAGVSHLVFPNANAPDNAAHLAVALTRNRPHAQQYFSKLGIQTAIHYPILDYNQAGFVGPASHELPNSELLANKILTLPLFPEMCESEIDFVQSAIEAYGRSVRA